MENNSEDNILNKYKLWLHSDKKLMIGLWKVLMNIL